MLTLTRSLGLRRPAKNDVTFTTKRGETCTCYQIESPDGDTTGSQTPTYTRNHPMYRRKYSENSLELIESPSNPTSELLTELELLKIIKQVLTDIICSTIHRLKLKPCFSPSQRNNTSIRIGECDYTKPLSLSSLSTITKIY